MPASIKIDENYHYLSYFYTKVEGTWKVVEKCWVKIDGNWRLIHPIVDNDAYAHTNVAGYAYVRHGAFTETRSLTISPNPNGLMGGRMKRVFSLDISFRPSNFGSGYPNYGSYLDIYCDAVRIARFDKQGMNAWFRNTYTFERSNAETFLLKLVCHSQYGDRGCSYTINSLTEKTTILT